MRQRSGSIALSGLLLKHHRSLVIQHKQECFISNRRWGLHHICMDETQQQFKTIREAYTIHSPCMGLVFCPFWHSLWISCYVSAFRVFFKPGAMETNPPCGVTFSRRHKSADHTLSQPLHKHTKAAAPRPLLLSFPVDVLTTKDSSQVTLKVTSISISYSFRHMLFYKCIIIAICCLQLIKQQKSAIAEGTVRFNCFAAWCKWDEFMHF